MINMLVLLEDRININKMNIYLLTLLVEWPTMWGKTPQYGGGTTAFGADVGLIDYGADLP